jgi:DNA-binding CsgD family transcriptional regulator
MDAVAAVQQRIARVTAAGLHLQQHVDGLEPHDLAATDEAIDSGERPVLLTAGAVPPRYATAFASPRGLVVELEPLTETDASTLIEVLTGARADRFALDYLLRLTGGLRGYFVSTVRRGLTMRWLAPVDGRLLLTQQPGFTDVAWAEQEVAQFTAVLEPDGLALLESLADSGPRQLDELMRDPQRRRELVGLEAQGVVRFDTATAAVHPPVLEQALQLLSRTRAQVSGAPVDPLEAFTGAIIDAQHGHLNNAKDRLEALSSASAAGFVAFIDAIGGRNRTASVVLSELTMETDTDYYTALDQIVRVFSGRRFIREESEEWVLADDPHLRELSRAARVVSEVERAYEPLDDGRLVGETAAARLNRMLDRLVEGRGALLELLDSDPPCPGLPHCPNCRAFPFADDRNRPHFALVSALTMQASTAATLGRDDLAREALAELESMDLTTLPIVGRSWTVEFIALARLQLDPEQEPFPHAWLEGEPFARRPLTAIAELALSLEGAICRGVPTAQLRDRLADLWALFETRNQTGIVDRPHVESLSLTVEGSADVHLVGPPGADITVDTQRPAFVPVQVVAEAGRLLGCAADALPEEWTRVAAESLPGPARLLARAIVLQRGGSLPPHVCAEFARAAEHAGVEPDIVALLHARADDDQRGYERARRALGETRPGLQAEPWRTAGRDDETAESLDTERLDELTARERAVVVRLVSADGTETIARTLGISPRTVESHARNAYRKLGVHSRTELRAEIVR